jgi:hypothetical protein
MFEPIDDTPEAEAERKAAVESVISEFHIGNPELEP